MRALIYINGMLTVIDNEIKVMNIESIKPDCITSDGVIYDEYRQVSITDSVQTPLTEEEIVTINSFIDNYAFTGDALYKSIEREHCVKPNGVYLGFVPKSGDMIAVPDAPIDLTKYYYDFTSSSWVLGYTIDITGKLMYDGVIGTTGYLYIPRSLVSNTVYPECQTYDFTHKSIMVDIMLARTLKNKELAKAMQHEMDITCTDVGGFGAQEEASFSFQVVEANAYIADQNAVVPLLRSLYEARKVSEYFADETLLTFANKVIYKNNLYSTYYGNLLGKYHGKVKALELATTLDEIVNINW